MPRRYARTTGRYGGGIGGGGGCLLTHHRLAMALEEELERPSKCVREWRALGGLIVSAA